MNRRSFLTLGAHKATPNRNTGRTAKPQARRNSNLTPQQLASRFLQQATLGATMVEINSVASLGIEGWINAQLNVPKTVTETYMRQAIAPVFSVEGSSFLGMMPFRWAWWQAVMTGQDQLRQRVAMALSEIFVISTRTDLLEDSSLAVGYFYDLLITHAFGNFRDLLMDVTLSPAMGYYLSHAGNRKSDPSVNRFPDENYAREVMQLFSIGLFELNQDGTRKLDGNGEPIPTYDNSVISEFAKIFTGMTYAPSAMSLEDDGTDPNTEDGFVFLEIWEDNATLPMQMYEQFHELGEKRLLNGVVVPSGQSGMQDVNDAIDNLFNHANVGPFIGRLLIQRLVKSHPSNAYIGRVAAAFNNNGSGVRGDMQAVIKAILLDDEARSTSFINDAQHGMLREPFIRYTHLCRAFEAKNEGGENLFYNSAEEIGEELGQYPFASPSVFNFFSPDFKPLGPLQTAGINGPEFQIMTSVSAIKRINFWDSAINDGFLMLMPDGTQSAEEQFPFVSDVVLDLAPYLAMQGDVNALIGRIDLLLTYGTLSSSMRNIMVTALNGLYSAEGDWGDVVRFAIYLFMSCPEYAILK